MRNLTPQRRRAAVLAACACILATAPTLLSHASTRAHDFIAGLCLGISIVLLITAISLIFRDRNACQS